jgi:hypothetical protein
MRTIGARVQSGKGVSAVSNEMSAEAEGSPLLEGGTRERLVKTQQAEKS